MSKDMVINYVPGEECRVAVVEDGRLEEFHAERMDAAGHVGNIYVGKVVNVEPAIQAAFVDFGLEHNGFLHVSDLHPRYFPGEDAETTERVGKKTPRRERPPIQAALRRGQEIAVQVLKEGVGTKGPTVTSYLSVPGRFLVMMPQMDRVGVSRKVEDEETRRKMREILDQLELPEGFGFILRTAGMERTKVELKRDLAYLQRLWKDMEKRWKSGNKPRLLYSESDLLVRALRDILTADIDRVVIDNEAAVNRAARFLKIVAPRSATKLVRYTGASPIYHAMGLEEQIQMIHAREVPLPSGGRLVIDETEALVAIDVNSGKSRDARDAETNAFRTNQEAVDEICRQLRLRDLGGVVVNDLIDMRQAKHRREIENRFRDNLKRDRARWTIAPISEFGILEMTRQRMRGSHESQHFSDCPICRGRGLVQRPDSVASDGLRDLAAVLDHDRVHRVEMVVNPRIAGELLSSKRRSLSRIERLMNKRVDVRVNEATPVDRVTFYAYDDRGADIDVGRLGHRTVRDGELQPYITPEQLSDDWASEGLDPEPEPVEPEPAVEADPHPIELEPDDEAQELVSASEGKGAEGEGAGRGRRRRRRGRGGRGSDPAGPSAGPRGPAGDRPARDADDGPRDQDAPGEAQDVDGGEGPAPDGAGAQPGEPGQGGRRRRRRRRRGRGGAGGAPGPMGQPGENGAYAPAMGEGPGERGEEPIGAGGDREGDDQDFDGPESADDRADDEGDQPETGGVGPDGQPLPPGQAGEPGQGGRRRRRRRRRGGRGRNRGPGGPGGPDQGAPAGGPPVDGARTDDWNNDGGDERPAGDEPANATGEDRGEGFDDGGDDRESRDDAGTMNGGDQPSTGEPGQGGPRRRRRRRGRGGRGGGAGEGPGGGPESSAPSSGPSDAPPRANQPRPERPAPPPQKTPPTPPAKPAPVVPKPRTLYSSRRKLAPGERRPGKDE
jgi:ribonuclease E